MWKKKALLEKEDIDRDYELLDWIPFIDGEDFKYVYRPNDDSYLFLSTMHTIIKENLLD